MKKYNAYGVLIVLLILLSGSLVYSILKNPQSLEKKVPDTLSEAPVSNYSFIDYSTTDTCWRFTFLDTGALHTITYGSLDQETSSCTPRTASAIAGSGLSVQPSETSAKILASTGADYFGSPAGILLLQLKLHSLGMLPFSKITGIYTPETFLALKALQEKKNFSATGYPNATTTTFLNTISFPLLAQ